MSRFSKLKRKEINISVQKINKKYGLINYQMKKKKNNIHYISLNIDVFN